MDKTTSLLVYTFSFVIGIAYSLEFAFPNHEYLEKYNTGLQLWDSCQMDGGVVGTCEEVEKCLKSGGIAMREGKVKICNRHFSNIYVCCRRPHLVAEELCDSWSHFWRQDGGCAIEHPLVIGGETANIGEFPHVAQVGQKYKTEEISFNCGGTLVSPHFVLTAAHCLLIPDRLKKHITFWVKLGEHDLEHDSSGAVTEELKGPLPSSLYGFDDLGSVITNGTGDMAPVEQLIQVDEIFIYPSYEGLFLKYHDIALIKLRSPASMTRRVLPACLPYQFPADDYEGQALTVVGWGSTKDEEAPSTLQKVDVPVIDRLTCSTMNVNNRHTPLGLTEDMLCAGENEKDSCQGDSGGPLSSRTPQNYYSCAMTVVGVVSYGIGMIRGSCGTIGVYTRVSAYLDWVTGIIAPGRSSYLTIENVEEEFAFIKSNNSLPLGQNSSNMESTNVMSRMSAGRLFPIKEFRNLDASANAHINDANNSTTLLHHPQILFGDSLQDLIQTDRK